MKFKNKLTPAILKLFILTIFFLCFLHVILTPNRESLKIHYPSLLSICNKIPHPLAQSLIHYASTNMTPQQRHKEISVTLRILEKKSPCNFLVFGVGHDSLMWASLNHGGWTVFLEEDKYWMSKVKNQMPTSLEMYHVVYDSKMTQALELLKIGKSRNECKIVSDPRFSRCPLVIKNLPKKVYEIEWDVIMVDAPTAHQSTRPGRMKAIYTAGLMGRNKRSGETDVLVHDVNRKVEDIFSKTFLCEGYLMEQVGILRRFTIPSHRNGIGGDFCP